MKLRLILFAVTAAMMAACSSEDEVAVNPDPHGDALTFSTSVGHSRATETNIGNLGNFAVVAKGVHPSGTIYDNYLIGSGNGGAVATKDPGSTNIWKLADNVYWPTSTPYAVFWAYTFSQVNGSKTSAVLPDGVTFSLETAAKPTAKLSGFTPVKNALVPQSGNYNNWDDGAEQTDMLVAFTSQQRVEGASNVALNFHHVLSQVRIQATSTDKSTSDHRIVKIKGAWLVNARDKADFTAKYDWDETENKAIVSDEWINHSLSSNNFSAYGSFFRKPVVLGRKTNANAEVDVQKLVDKSLMLIPQTLEEWNKNQTPEGTVAENNHGAYILLLCRVELEHEGKSHEGATDLADVKVVGNMHYHQQFPVNAENKFDDAEYGFVAVPVGTTFEPNKKYLYTLNICGAASGAGNYPPDLIEKFKTLVPKAGDKPNEYDKFAPRDGEEQIYLKLVARGDVKKVGDPVLDEPIQFTVSVGDWDGTWTSGNVKF